MEASRLFQCAKLHTLRLAECGDVADLSALKEIKSLTLTRCNGVVDVTPLANIDTVVIDRCLRVTDVSSLKHVKSLTIDRCPKVLGIARLTSGKLESLTLRKCRNVRDLSGLGTPGSSLKNLTLAHMHNVEDVSMLTNLNRLELIECPGVKEVAMLSCLPELIIRRCRGIRDQDDLIGLPGVVVELWGGTGSSSPRRHNSSSCVGRTSTDSLLEAVEDGVANGSLREAQSTLSLDSVGSTFSGDSQFSWSLTDAVGAPSSPVRKKTPSPPPSPPRVSADDSDDWVEAGRKSKQTP